MIMHLSHYKSEITIENDKKLDQIIEKVIQKLVDHVHYEGKPKITQKWDGVEYKNYTLSFKSINNKEINYFISVPRRLGVINSQGKASLLRVDIDSLIGLDYNNIEERNYLIRQSLIVTRYYVGFTHNIPGIDYDEFITFTHEQKERIVFKHLETFILNRINLFTFNRIYCGIIPYHEYKKKSDLDALSLPVYIPLYQPMFKQIKKILDTYLARQFISLLHIEGYKFKERKQKFEYPYMTDIAETGIKMTYSYDNGNKEISLVVPEYFLIEPTTFKRKTISRYEIFIICKKGKKEKMFSIKSKLRYSNIFQNIFDLTYYDIQEQIAQPLISELIQDRKAIGKTLGKVIKFFR
ncbi:hypothetical protein HN681_04725 [archaeon]|jgi:hypothetical protein|nr:hypothetical protein [archaeon]MBT3731012.1 hypothetical protein [archaeon]MBT4669750.1 hypothetical protein [archaeon]MBT5029900.1 hypothetical protein [archaeon]MBT5288472.1 hypothetical protein [archaeon]